MSETPSSTLAGPRPPLRNLAIRFDPDDSHPVITELCLREREEHRRGEHEHIAFIPTRAA
jgi:hypothetical protein